MYYKYNYYIFEDNMTERRRNAVIITQKEEIQLENKYIILYIGWGGGATVLSLAAWLVFIALFFVILLATSVRLRRRIQGACILIGAERIDEKFGPTWNETTTQESSMDEYL